MSDFEKKKNEYRRRLGGSINSEMRPSEELDQLLDTPQLIVIFDWLQHVPRSDYLKDCDAHYKVVYTLYENGSQVISNPVH